MDVRDHGTSNDATLNYAGMLLDNLLATNIEMLQVPAFQQTENSTFMDPRSIRTIKAQTKKIIHITQFLSEKSKRRRQNRRKENVLRSDSEETLVIKTDDEHPYLGITIDELGAANMRLLNHLIMTKAIQMTEFYLAYTTTVFEFAAIYEWNSVMNF